MSDKPTAAQIHETLFDGRKIEVEFTDGRKEFVKVRKISQQDIPEFVTVKLSPFDTSLKSRELKLYSPDVSHGTLTDDSQDLILKEGDELNRPLLLPFLKDRLRHERILLEIQEAVPGMAEVGLRMMELETRLNARVPTNGFSASGIGTPISGPTVPTR